jgi:hypothetical protein
MFFLLACLVLAASPAPATVPMGETPATAIVDPETNESGGVAWEYRYLRDHPCDGDAAWKVQQQALVQANKRVYDRLHVVCPTTKVERDVFFDITSYFGKY